jgi:hypothetical protein
LAFVRCDTSGTDMREYVEEQQLWLYWAGIDVLRREKDKTFNWQVVQLHIMYSYLGI